MKTVKVFTILVSLAIFFGFLGIASAGTLDEILKRGELRIACQTQGAPYSFMDRNGNRTGSSVEICNMIAEEMGVKVKFLNYDWDGLIPALLSKKADMLAADMTPTLKRAMKISFTNPYMYAGSVVFVKQDSPIKTLEDIKAGTKLAVLLVKDSSVVSAIGVVDITRVGWLTMQRIPEGLMVFGLVGLLYFAICYPLINLSGFLERRMTVASTKL